METPTEESQRALRLFETQYKNIVGDIPFGKNRENLLGLMPKILSVYNYRSELFPCIKAAESIFFGFCCRTGRGALFDGLSRIKAVRDRCRFPSEPDQNHIYSDSLIICGGKECGADLTVTSQHSASLGVCPRCSYKDAILLFRLRPPDVKQTKSKADGSFGDILVEKDGLVFLKSSRHAFAEKLSTPRKFRFEEISLIHVEFFRFMILPLWYRTNGRFEIKLYDVSAKETFTYHTAESFRDSDFQSFLATIAEQNSDVPILAVKGKN